MKRFLSIATMALAFAACTPAPTPSTDDAMVEDEAMMEASSSSAMVEDEAMMEGEAEVEAEVMVEDDAI